VVFLNVAQFFKLLYRRIAFGWAARNSGAAKQWGAPQIEKSAMQQSAFRVTW